MYSPRVLMLDRAYTHPGAKYVTVFKGLGIAKLIIGTIMMVASITTLVLAGTFFDYAVGFSYFAAGLWCGALTFSTGFLATVAGREGENCPVISTMVLAIFTAIAAAAMFCIETAASYYNYLIMVENNVWSSNFMLALHCILCVLAFVVLVLAIVLSAFCCKVKCCMEVHPVVDMTNIKSAVSSPGPYSYQDSKTMAYA